MGIRKGCVYSLNIDGDARNPTTFNASNAFYMFSHILSGALVAAATVIHNHNAMREEIHSSTRQLPDLLDMIAGSSQGDGKLSASEFENLGKVMLQRADAVDKSYMLASSFDFLNNALFARIVDSFEFYIKSIVRLMITKHPGLMISERQQGKDAEYTVKISKIIAFESESTLTLLNAVIDDFVDSLMAGPGYLNGITFIAKKLHRKEKLLGNDWQKSLRAVSDIRNSITHDSLNVSEENESVLLGLISFKREGTEIKFDLNTLNDLGVLLSKFILLLEKEIISGYWNSKDFRVDVAEVKRNVIQAIEIIEDFNPWPGGLQFDIE